MEGWLSRLSHVESGISRLALWALELIRTCRKVPWLLERGFMDTGCGYECLATLGKRVRSYERFETISRGYNNYDHYFLHAWPSWGYFWPYVRPRAENAWSELPGLLLVICSARGWKSSEWAAWGHFWPYVRPGAENAKNKLPGASFCYMCGHWLRMLKISCRFTVFQSSGFARSICPMDGEYKKSSHVDVWLSKIFTVDRGLNCGKAKSPLSLEIKFTDTGDGNKCLVLFEHNKHFSPFLTLLVAIHA